MGIMEENLLDYIKSAKNCNKFSMNIGNARVYDDGKGICACSIFIIFYDESIILLMYLIY